MALRFFCQMCRNSANTPHFHGERHRNPAKGALQDGALRSDHQSMQSAALLVGEKWRECRHVLKCRCGTFGAFFLMRTVYGDIPSTCVYTSHIKSVLVVLIELFPILFLSLKIALFWVAPESCTKLGKIPCRIKTASLAACTINTTYTIVESERVLFKKG